MAEFLESISLILVWVVLGIGVLLDRIRDARIKRLESMMNND